jgi:hypothetical protein
MIDLKAMLVCAVAMFAGAVAPKSEEDAATCETQGCHVKFVPTAVCGSVDSDLPPEPDAQGNGSCTCDGPICIWSSHCNKDVVITFTAPSGHVLCKGTTSYGSNEQVTISVKKCGDGDLISFEARDTNCTGRIACTMFGEVMCPRCGDNTCF